MKKHMLVVDFNDQYHAIKRKWGDRSLNVRALRKRFPEADCLIGVAKAPDTATVQRFEQMLRHNGFNCSYMFGAPSWQTCSLLLLERVIEIISFQEPFNWHVTLVSGSPDAEYLQCIINLLGSDCQVFGFSDLDWITQLPPSVLTPVPRSYAMNVQDVVDLEGHVEA